MCYKPINFRLAASFFPPAISTSNFKNLTSPHHPLHRHPPRFGVSTRCFVIAAHSDSPIRYNNVKVGTTDCCNFPPQRTGRAVVVVAGQRAAEHGRQHTLSNGVAWLVASTRNEQNNIRQAPCFGRAKRMFMRGNLRRLQKVRFIVISLTGACKYRPHSQGVRTRTVIEILVSDYWSRANVVVLLVGNKDGAGRRGKEVILCFTCALVSSFRSA